MTRINLLSGFAVSALALLAGTAQGGARVWVGGASGQETEWNNAANWDGGASVPSNNDAIVIPNVTHQPIYNETTGANSFAKVTIESGADLRVTGSGSVAFFATQLELAANASTAVQVDTGALFTLTGDSGTDLVVGAGSELHVQNGAQFILNITSGASTDIDGDIHLDAGANSGSVLKINQSIALTGDGAINISSDTSSDPSDIQIAAEEVLQNLLTGGVYVDGYGTITGLSGMGGVGEFENDASVTVDDGGTLDMEAMTFIENSGGDWSVENNSLLVFHRASSLTGDFANTDSLIRFNANVTTTGGYVCNDGDIDVDSTFFTYHLGNPFLQRTISSDQNDCM